MSDFQDHGSASCPCGEGWFRLEGEHGAVCIDTKGMVTGYAGRLVCISCGEEWQPPVERRAAFRVVGAEHPEGT